MPEHNGGDTMRTSSVKDWNIGDVGYTSKTEHTIKVVGIVSDRYLKVKYLCGCDRSDHEKIVFIPSHGEVYKNIK